MAVPALLCNPSDSVAIAVKPLVPGDRVTLCVDGCETVIEIAQPIPSGHKFAVRCIPAGQSVIKYGETIGKATDCIAQGRHVHLHNLEGLRGRGDLR